MKNSITETLLWLVDNGFPSLPVAPAQDPEKYPAKNKDGSVKRDGAGNPVPLFTGKNPSFLDKAGIPRIVNHQTYQAKLPTQKDIDRWFANPQNGIGTLGGWNNVYWIDVDRKNFDSQEECDRAFFGILDSHEGLRDGYWEQTHSGGYRLAVKLASKPGFTNFALEAGGKHIGEVLGEGRFTVLAPTVGPSGKAYTNHSRNFPAEIASLEAIGIYPHGRTNNVVNKVQKPEPRIREALPGSIPLDLLATDDARQVLNGNDIKGDRSASLTMAIREFIGWENWTHDNDISVRGTAEELAFHAGSQLGMDEARVERILSRIDRNCHPAAQEMGGDKSCWLRVRSLDKATYNAKCPEAIKKDVMPLGPVSKDENGAELDFNPRKEAGLAYVAAREWAGSVIYDGKLKDWLKYEDKQPGVWSVVEEDVVLGDLKRVASTLIGETYGHSYVKGGFGLLRVDERIYRQQMNSNPDVLIFENTALNTVTGETIPHSADAGATWALKRKYDPQQRDWEPIATWLQHALPVPEMQDRLICYHAAVLRNLFQELDGKNTLIQIGESGAGKGTSVRLCEKLVGEHNVFPIDSIHALEETSFALDGIEEKNPRIVTLPDQQPLQARFKIDRLLNLTGKDYFSLNRKHRKNSHYRYLGGVIINSTHYPFSMYHRKRGMVRRSVVVSGWRKDPIVAGIERQFTEEVISAYTNFLLSLPKEVVLETLQNAPGEPSVEEDAKTDPMTAWFADCIEVTGDQFDRIQLGSDATKSGTLFASYVKYCENANMGDRFIRNKVSFSNDFSEFFKTITVAFKAPDIHMGTVKPGNKLHYTGIKFKTEIDDSSQIGLGITGPSKLGQVSSLLGPFSTQVSPQTLIQQALVSWLGPKFARTYEATHSETPIEESQNQAISPPVEEKQEVGEPIAPDLPSASIEELHDLTRANELTKPVVERVSDLTLTYPQLGQGANLTQNPPKKPSFKVGDHVGVKGSNKAGLIVEFDGNSVKIDGDRFCGWQPIDLLYLIEGQS